MLHFQVIFSNSCFLLLNKVIQIQQQSLRNIKTELKTSELKRQAKYKEQDSVNGLKIIPSRQDHHLCF